MTTITPETYAFFKAAGVFRVKTPEKARERFDDALPDYIADNGRLSEHDDEHDIAADGLFAALMERQEADKSAKMAAEIERERKRAEREAKRAALPITGGMDAATDHIRELPHGRYVLTSAQNNTDLDGSFWLALQAFCKRMNAQLLVGRMTYNKGGFQQPDVNDSDGIYYADDVKPYLVNGQLDLGGRFHFLADANVIPTAKFPTSGFDAATPAGIGAIIPATRIELRTSAALKGGVGPKVITSTGTVTKRNYIMRKTGAIAAFGHNIGALYVDTETGEIRHLEQMETANGFFDVDGFYSGAGFRPLATGDVAAFQPGDIHAEKAHDENVDAVIALIKRFRPVNVFVHDLLDFSSRNHHNIKDPFFLRAQYVEGNTVAGDLDIMAGTLDDIVNAYKPAKVHVIESNHDLAADTWLKNADWKADPINAETYLQLALAKVQGGDTFNTLAYAYEEIGGGQFADSTRLNFHQTDESVIVAGVEMGCHGHNGANGSRGSPKQFSALGVPMNTGHTHSPSIYGRVYTAGVTASLEMGYNIGASSWMIAHVITYANGQRQIIFA